MRVLNKTDQLLNHLTDDAKRKSGGHLTRRRRTHRNCRQFQDFLQ